MPASYRKLRNGDWGIQVQGAATVGEKVKVRTKAGVEKEEVVEKVLFTGNGVAICAIKPSPKPAGSSSRRGRSSGGGNGCAACGRGGHLVEDLEDGLMKHPGCCDMPPGGY